MFKILGSIVLALSFSASAENFSFTKPVAVAGLTYTAYNLMCRLDDTTPGEYQLIYQTPSAEITSIALSDTFLDRAGVYAYLCNMTSEGVDSTGASVGVSRPGNTIAFTLYDGSLTAPIPQPPLKLTIQ